MIKASRTKRLIALIIDFLICGAVVILVLLFGLPGLISLISDNQAFSLITVWALIDLFRWLMVSILFICAYFTLIPAIIPGQTLGKKLLRIKVIRKNGDNATFTTMFVREIIGRLLFDFTSLGISLLLSIVLMISPHHETLHDTLADTIVIEK